MAWSGAADLAAALQSSQPDLVRAALNDLDGWVLVGPGLPMPEAGVLYGLRDERREEDDLRAIRRYPGFDPPPEWADIVANEVDALLLHGTDRVAAQVAEDLRTDFDAIGATREALRRMGRRGAFTAEEADAVERLVRRLLVHPELRPVIVDGVAEWEEYESEYPIFPRVRALLPDQ